MPNLKETVSYRLSKAQTALDTALESGDGDTTELRAAVAAAKHDMEAVAAEGAAAQEAAAAEIEAQMIDQANHEVEVATDQLHAQISELAAIALPEIDFPVGVAINVQRAGYMLQAARETESAASERHDGLQQRLQALQSARQTIINRRAAGTVDDQADKADLALADADIEGLQPLIESAVADLQQAQAASHEAQKRFDQTLAQWSGALSTEQQRVLAVLGDSVDRALTRVAALVTERRGMSVTGYRPSPELRQMLSRF